MLSHTGNHLAPALDIQLAEQVVDMQLGCRETDVQPTGDFLVTEPRRDQLGGLPFALGERNRRKWRIATDAEAFSDSDRGSARRPPGPSRVGGRHEYP